MYDDKVISKETYDKLQKHFEGKSPNETFRLSETGDFEPFHNDNDKEYIVFEWLKKELGEKASGSISMGMGMKAGLYPEDGGFTTSKEMFEFLSNGTEKDHINLLKTYIEKKNHLP